MTDLVNRLNDAGAVAVRLVPWALAQSTVAALAIAGLARLSRSPEVRFWLWQAVAVKLLLLPFWTVALTWPNRPANAETSVAPVNVDPTTDKSVGDLVTVPDAPVTVSSNPTSEIGSTRTGAKSPALTWPAVALLAWMAAIAWRAAVLVRQRWRLRKVLRNSTPCDDPALSRLLHDLAAKLRLRWVPAIVFVEGGGSPFVCGLRHPTLVLPRAVHAALREAQLRQVLLHELAHLKRGDLWSGWLPEIARVVWFFHPVAHWTAARIRLERELACDRVALAHGSGDAADYADTLVKVAEQ
jgi:bla regulator protein BlaR1